MKPLFASLMNSFRGLLHAARSERAVRQEIAALALGIPAAWLLSGDWWMRAALIGSILLILAVECLNTAIEKLCDHVTPERDPEIGVIKDVSSAAVLCVVALGGLVWGAALLEAFG